LKPKERENCVRSFVSKLYKVTGDNKVKEVDRILEKLAPPVMKCKLQHLRVTNQAKVISQIVVHLQVLEGFRKRQLPHLDQE
jgi:hypothetical protein